MATTKKQAFSIPFIGYDYPYLNNDKEMEKIVNELKTLKVKRDQNSLIKEDSLRIDYLFNQYQKIKNGH